MATETWERGVKEEEPSLGQWENSLLKGTLSVASQVANRIVKKDLVETVLCPWNGLSFLTVSFPICDETRSSVKNQSYRMFDMIWTP
jgi:hypothetical protein